MDLTNSLQTKRNQTQSLELNTAIKLIEPIAALTEIKDALIRLAKLYQVQNFDASNAVLLAEWIANEFKHKPLKLIIDTLNHPPVTFEEGQVSRNWRLTPDTVYIWIEKKAKEVEELRQIEQTRKEHAKLGGGTDLSPKGQEMINAYLAHLSKDMFKRNPLPKDSKLDKIDFLLKMINAYKKECVDPITGELFEDALDEREWLLNKGYFLYNGELKELK